MFISPLLRTKRHHSSPPNTIHISHSAIWRIGIISLDFFKFHRIISLDNFFLYIFAPEIQAHSSTSTKQMTMPSVMSASVPCMPCRSCDKDSQLRITIPIFRKEAQRTENKNDRIREEVSTRTFIKTYPIENQFLSINTLSKTVVHSNTSNLDFSLQNKSIYLNETRD